MIFTSTQIDCVENSYLCKKDREMNINGQNIFLKGVRNEHIPQKPEDYPFTLPVVRNLISLEFNRSVTYIVGENGSGKSTLLEAIATILRLNPEGGSRNFNFKTCETHSRLYEDLRPIRADLSYRNAFFFRAESFYNVASEVDRLQMEDGRMLDSYGGRSLHEQSHGERMKDAVAAGSQVIIATHSPVILSFPDAEILVIDDGRLIPTDYEDCYIYRDMLSFIMNRNMIINELLR